MCDRRRSPFHLLSFPQLKTVNRRRIFLHHRHTVGVHGHESLRSCFSAVVPHSRPRIAGACAHRPITSGHRPQAATPRRFRLFTMDRLFWLLLYRMRPQLRDALVLVKPATPIGWHPKMAITPLWTTQDECRNSRPHPRDEFCQPVVGRASRPWRMPKLSVEVNRATVARYLPRRPKALSRLGPAFCTARIADPFIFPIVVLSRSHNVLLGVNPH